MVPMKYLFTLLLVLQCHAANLQTQYQLHWRQPSDINEHLPHLRRLAKECPSVTELGVRSMNSTWGLLLGLSEILFSPHVSRRRPLFSSPRKI